MTEHVSKLRGPAYGLSLVLIFVSAFENLIDFPGFGTVSRAVGLAAAGLWALSVLETQRLRQPGLFQVTVCLLVAWNLCSLLWSHDLDASVEKAATWVLLAGLVLLLWDVYTTKRALRAGLLAYLMGSYVSIAATVISFRTGVTAEYGRYAAEGFNPNGLALILALGLPVACYLAATRRESAAPRLTALLALAYIPCALLGIGLTGTRTALLASAPALLFGLWSLRMAGPAVRIGVVIGVLTALYGVIGFVPDFLLERLASTGDELQQGDFTGRTFIWAESLRVIRDSPILGVGTGAFRAAVGLDKVAHNSVLSILVELGLVGLTLYAAALVIAVRAALRAPRLEAAFWLALLATWAIGASALTWEHHKQSWLVLGLAVCGGSLLAESRGRRSAPMWPAFGDSHARVRQHLGNTSTSQS